MIRPFPKPHQVPRPQYERLPERNTVTIAAGFVCEEGILICADTEYTSSGDKLEAAKIFPRSVDNIEFLFTGAGDRSLIAMTTDMICDAIEKENVALAGMSLSSRTEEVRRIITTQNQIVYSQYVNYANPPISETQMSIGFLSRDGDICEYRLLGVGSPTVERIDTYECIGAGASIGRWLAKTFYYESCPLDLIKVAALYIVQEAKANVPYCGGGTTIYTLKVKPENRRRMTLWDDESLARDVQRAMRDILFLPRNKSLDDRTFEEMLADLMRRIRDIRADRIRVDNPPFDVSGEGTSLK